MEGTDRESLARFAREKHVHYELAAEEVPAGEELRATEFQVRLFATAGEPLEPPGSRRHAELLGELRSFAERVVLTGGAEGRAEIVPTTAPPLYASSEGDDDAEEAVLTVRVRCDAPEHRGAGGEDRCIGEVRQRLDAVGVPRR